MAGGMDATSIRARSASIGKGSSRLSAFLLILGQMRRWPPDWLGVAAVALWIVNGPARGFS